VKLFVLLMSLLPSLLFAGNLVTPQEYQKLSIKQKVQILKAYKSFIQEVLKNENETEELTARLRFVLIDSAYASDAFNCFYAGWPSFKKTTTKDGKTRTYCSSPLKSNPEYKKLSEACGQGQLLCQPVLFGSKLCIDVKTQAQRNLAFSQCQQKFDKSGKTIEEIAQSLNEKDIAPLADEMFALVHDICEGNTFQSKTGMCTNLKKKVAAVKENRPTQNVVQSKINNVQIIDEGEIVEDHLLKEKLLQSIIKVDELPVVTVDMNRKVICDECERQKTIQALDEVLAPHEASESIDQNKVTEKDFCAGNKKGNDRQKYSQGVFSDSDNGVSINVTYQQPGEDKEHRVVGGYEIDADRMGPQAYSYIEEGVEYSSEDMAPMYPQRSYSDSYEGRGKESVFEIVDMPVKEVYKNKKLVERYQSTDLRITQLTFFPRKNVPSVKKRDDKIIMKLTTGEEMTVDAKTGRVISGAGKEIPAKNKVEVRPTDKRTYPDSDFSYQGEGLYIESKVTDNKDERKPGSIVPVKALVDGVLQVCKLKSEDIWQRDYGSYIPFGEEGSLSSEWHCTRLKFQKDEELYALIKKTCPTFKFPPLAK
jgi:hypothetical protein